MIVKKLFRKTERSAFVWLKKIELQDELIIRREVINERERIENKTNEGLFYLYAVTKKKKTNTKTRVTKRINEAFVCLFVFS